MSVEASNSRQQQWDAYLKVERRGSRTEKLAALDRFIDTLLQTPRETWTPWALELASSIVDDVVDIPVRRQLFERVLFPALVDGVDSKHAGCKRWLAGFAPYVRRCPSCVERLGPKLSSEWGLLESALIEDPADFRSRRRLISLFADQFEYSLHELPTGVLYGTDGATASQCDELVAELGMFRSLLRAEGCEGEYRELTEACDLHFNAYKQYLLERPSHENYAEFLRQTRRAGR